MADDFGTEWHHLLEGRQERINVEIDKVFDAHHDKSVPEVMAALRLMFSEVDMFPTDKWLRPYAKAISRGKRVRFDLG
jgi:hypothetical protein